METAEKETTGEKGITFQKEVIGEGQGFLLVLTGPTGVGKDTTMGKVLRKYSEMERIISVTTRGIREEYGEVHGEDYIFIDPREFLEMVEGEKFLETNKYGNDYYGTLKEDIEPVLRGKNLIWRVDPSMATTVEELFREEFPPDIAEELIKRTLVIYIGTPRLTVLKDRVLLRAGDKGETGRNKFKKRVKGDWDDWNRYGDRFENVVINETGFLNKTVKEVSDLIEAHRRNVAKLSETRFSPPTGGSK